MTAKPIIAATAACLALAACSKGEPPAGGEASAGASRQADVAAKSNEIPAAMQGRWGLAAADCASAGAEGLLEIGPMNLRFHESIARLMNVADESKTHIKGSFSWSGEGSDWDGAAALDLRDGGRTLVLTAQGANAAPGPQTFSRCQ
ncbi:MAG: hypothetical protein KGL48_15475 [Sphingomonadales bacterium]|nr:hypothetical protein [Sphingomonadales bacterium]MDE2567531.1 hypothetical protein [Sphingomonadales bacterium]